MNTMIRATTLAAIGALTIPATLWAKADASLVHRYSFSDGTAKDSVGKADGKVVGDVKIGKGSAEFSATPGSRIELLAKGPNGININGLKAVTFEVWYSSNNTGKERAFQRVFEFGATSTGLDQVDSAGSHYVHFTPTAKTQAAAAITDNGWQEEAVANAPTPADNTKTHAVIVIDDKKISLYIDGKLAGSTALISQSLDQLSNDYALLGASVYHVGEKPLGALMGNIDEFRIYDRALTSEQIGASFNAGPDRPAVK